MSMAGSPISRSSPGLRTMSMSPSLDMGVGGLNRQNSDFGYLQQGGPLPPHLRVGSPASTTSGGYNTGMRPTSHPGNYGPPPTLEPSVEHHAGPGSAGGSPHMSSVGWQSPAHMGSPAPAGPNYGYADPNAYPQNAAMGQMYYGTTSDVRRPPSTEPGMVHMA